MHRSRNRLHLAGILTRRASKAMVLLALLGGIPYGLVTQIGWPLPRHLPQVSQIGQVLTAPVSETLVLNALAVALWILWAAFATSVAVEVVAALRGVPAPRLRAVAPMQTLAEWLVAGVVTSVLVTAPLTVTGAHPAAAAAAPPAAATVIATPSRAVPAGAAHTASAAPAIVLVSNGGPLAPASGAAATAQSRPSAASLVYEVRHGDWLGAVAQRFLGDFHRYPEIGQLNPDLIRDASHIEPRWRLILPADAYDRGPRQHATGNLILPAQAAPAAAGKAGRQASPGTPPGPGAAGTTAPPADMTAPPAPEPAGATPGASTVTPASPAGDSTSPTGSPGAAHDSQQPDVAAPGHGVVLPGGWVGLPLAGALVAAAAMVWRRRRHRYVLHPPDPPAPDDADLRALPPVMNRLRRAVREHAPQMLRQAPPSQPTIVEYVRGEASARAPLPPTGPSGADLAGLTNRLPTGGLGLTGPGADAAVRALLVATLSSGGPADPDARGRVVIPLDALTTLLGVQAVTVSPLPRLEVTASLPEALTRVEELLIERRRTLLDYESEDIAGMRAADPYHPPMPPVLLLAEAPPPELRARLSTTLHLGGPLHINAVLLGDWPRGDTHEIRSDGRTGDSDRLAVLDMPTTLQLLQVLREAHTGQQSVAPVEPGTGTDVDAVPPPYVPPATPVPEPGLPDNAQPQVEPQPGGVHTPPAPTGGEDSRPPAPPPPTTPVQPAGTAGPPPSAAAGSTPKPARGRPQPVRVRLLGQPTIFDRDGAPVPGLRHHARELLAYLAVHRNGADLPQIMEAFWPTATVRRASERLSTEVADLRRRIRQAAGDTSIQPVVNTGGRYHLDPNIVDVDMWRLLDALRHATGTTDPAARIATLREAVQAHTGGFADGYEYDWIEQPREQIRRHGIRARMHLADLVAGTEPATAAELARAAADLDPLNEDVARRAMRALARIGDAGGIRALLQRLRRELDEIDEEPTTDTIALAAQLQQELTDGRAGRTHLNAHRQPRDR